MIFLKQGIYIRYVIAKLSKFVFYRGFSENWKGPGTSFQATIFIEFFDNFFFVILHKVAKFH